MTEREAREKIVKLQNHLIEVSDELAGSFNLTGEVENRIDDIFSDFRRLSAALFTEEDLTGLSSMIRSRKS